MMMMIVITVMMKMIIMKIIIKNQLLLWCHFTPIVFELKGPKLLFIKKSIFFALATLKVVKKQWMK